MNTIKKTILTIIIASTLCIAEWEMWHFFRYEFREYNPSDETAAIVFIAWMFLAVIFAVMACALLAETLRRRTKLTLTNSSIQCGTNKKS